MYKGTEKEKEILRIRYKKWYEKNKENRLKKKLYNKLYRMKNRKRLNEYTKKYLIRTGKTYRKKGDSKRVSLHRWIEKQLGIRKKCEICGDTNPNKRYQWSNKDHKYTKDLDMWQRVCPSCHREYDMKYNGIKTWTQKFAL